MKSLKITSHSCSQTKKIARLLASRITAPCLIALDGDLGAGKTTFVTGFIKGLEKGKKIKVQSPTFALARLYPTKPPLHHIDLYRIHDAATLEDLGIETLLFDPAAIVCVEWPSQYPNTLPPTALWIFIQSKSKNQREFEFKFNDSACHWETILEKII